MRRSCAAETRFLGRAGWQPIGSRTWRERIVGRAHCLHVGQGRQIVSERRVEPEHGIAVAPPGEGVARTARAVPDDENRAPDGERPVPDGGRPAPDGGRPVPDDERPVPDGGRPACNAEWSMLLSTNSADWNPINGTVTLPQHTFNVPIGGNQAVFILLKVTIP